ncbi:MAG: hypothetical protein WCJ58_03170 [bacterium]
MNPTKSFEKQIFDVIVEKKQVSAKSIREILKISEPSLFKHLKNLLSEKRISKIGKPPKVFYMVTVPSTETSKIKLPKFENKITKYIDQNYLIITPRGKINLSVPYNKSSYNTNKIYCEIDPGYILKELSKDNNSMAFNLTN